MSDLCRQLLDTTATGWNAAWGNFLFNVELVRSLGHPAEATAIIQAGEGWQGDGWTTSRASRVLHEVTGVPLVAATIGDYKAAFLYGLALHWSLDVASFNLSERAADAALDLRPPLATVRKEIMRRRRTRRWRTTRRPWRSTCFPGKKS